MNISKGNLFKPLELSLTLNGAPFVILGDDTLSMVWLTPESKTRITVTPTVVNLLLGQVRYDFTAGQTDEVGSYEGQITITRSGKPISFPDDGSYFRWNVNRTL